MVQGVDADVVLVWELEVVPVAGHGVADSLVPVLVIVDSTPIDVDAVPAVLAVAVELVLGQGVVEVDAVEVVVPEVDLVEVVADVSVETAPLTPVVPLTPTESLTPVVPLTLTDPVTPAAFETVPDAVLPQSAVKVELFRPLLSRLEMRPNVCPRK